MKILLDVASRLLLGGVFVYASWSKIQDPAIFADAVAGYAILPDVFVGFLALVLPMAELLAGMALMCTKWSREAAAILTTLLLVFLFGLTQAWIRGLDISCGCFGPDDPSGAPPLWVDILRDIGLLIPAVWLLLRPNAWTWQYSTVCPLFASAILLFSARPDCDGVAPSTAPAVEEDAKTRRIRAKRVSAEVKAYDADTNKLLSVETVIEGLKGQIPRDIVPEKWETRFATTLAVAVKHHRPNLIVIGAEKCGHCNRLWRAMQSEEVSSWIKGRNVYLSHLSVDTAKTNLPEAEDHKLGWQFVRDTVKHLQGSVHHRYNIPLVAIYWDKGDGVPLRTAFVGRSGMTLVKTGVSIEADVIASLDKIFADYSKTK